MKALLMTSVGVILIAVAGGCAKERMAPPAPPVAVIPQAGVGFCNANKLILVTAIDNMGNVMYFHCPYVGNPNRPISQAEGPGKNAVRANEVRGVILADVVKWKMRDDPDPCTQVTLHGRRTTFCW